MNNKKPNQNAIGHVSRLSHATLSAQALRRKVDADAELLSLVQSLARTVAEMRGDVLRLVHATPRKTADNAALNRLVSVAARAMNKPGFAVSWTVAELMGRCLLSDELAHELATAIRALPCTQSAKGVGKFLSAQVIEKYSTPDGLTLWREYSPGDVVQWSIKEVFKTRKVVPPLY